MTVVVSGWTTCYINTTFLHDYPCFFALQETVKWNTSAMNIVYGNDHGRTAILCPWEVDHFRRAWVDKERCTAIMVGSTLLLSVYMPHSGRDEEDYIEALETVRATLTEGKTAGAVDFLFAVTSILNLGYRGGGEDTIAHEKNEVTTTIERLELHRDKHLDE